MNRALDVLEEPVEAATQGSLQNLQAHRGSGNVSLSDVWFTYPGGAEPVLRGIDLQASAGQTIALVGPSGGGKSTLTNLIARFYDPDRGTVRLDDVDILSSTSGPTAEYWPWWIRIFSSSTARSAKTSPAATGRTARTQIIEAARTAHAHDFIVELPQGYDTPVGERSLRLSGGQRQRIAIARAILADPNILILDEATSHLDPENERLIQQSLASLMAGRTCFVIAHRLSTIRHADQILMIENGRITDRGKHDELMLNSGRYRRMIELQIGRIEPPPRPDEAVA